MPTLNRRGFLQSLSATGVVPLFPALPAAAAAPVGHTSIQYVWASYFAQANNACSVPQIMSALNVPTAVAESLMQRLVSANVLTTPAASGVAQLKTRSYASESDASHRPATGTQYKLDLDNIMRIVTRNIAVETQHIGIAA